MHFVGCLFLIDVAMLSYILGGGSHSWNHKDLDLGLLNSLIESH